MLIKPGDTKKLIKKNKEHVTKINKQRVNSSSFLGQHLSSSRFILPCGCNEKQPCELVTLKSEMDPGVDGAQSTQFGKPFKEK